MKNCLYCNNEISNRNNFCDFQCYSKYERENKIKSWLDGKHSGMRGKTSTAKFIKQYLIELHGEKCCKCGWSERNIHTGNIPIELDHMDGDFTNNKIENLQLVCPNCHSLGKHYKGNNKKGRPRSKYYRGL